MPNWKELRRYRSLLLPKSGSGRNDSTHEDFERLRRGSLRSLERDLKKQLGVTEEYFNRIV